MILGSADTSVVNVTKATQKSVEFTPTRTSFIMTAGPMDVNLTFISPIEPGDLVRQSMPFSYLSLSATSNDGNSHSIRFYSDISGEFMAGDTTQTAQWAYDDQSGEYVILSMQLQAQQKYTEVNDLAQDSVEYYAVKKVSTPVKIICYSLMIMPLPLLVEWSHDFVGNHRGYSKSQEWCCI